MAGFLSIKDDLRVPRSPSRIGGVHLLEGFTQSPTASARTTSLKGHASTAHLFGHSSSLKNRQYTTPHTTTALNTDEKKLLLGILTRHRRRNVDEEIPKKDSDAVKDVVAQYEHKAYQALHSHDYDAAIHIAREIIQLVSRIFGHTSSLCIYAGVILGEAYCLKGDIGMAKKYLLAAERRLEHVEDAKSAQTLRAAIACYTKMGDVFCTEAQLAKDNGDFEHEKTSVDYANDAYTHAAYMLDQSGGDSTYCYSRIGHLEQGNGQFVAATVAYEAALATSAHFSRTANDMNYLLAHKQLADCLLLRNRFAAALEHYIFVFQVMDEKSRTIQAPCKREAEVACIQTTTRLALSIATCLRAVCNFSEAAKMAEGAATVIKSALLDAEDKEAGAINVMKELEAMDLADQLVENTGLYIQCLESLGHTHTAWGDYAKAETFYEKGMALVDELVDGDVAMERRGNLYMFLGDVKVYEFMATRTPENSRPRKDPYATRAVATAPIMGTANTANKVTTPRTNDGNRGAHELGQIRATIESSRTWREQTFRSTMALFSKMDKDQSRYLSKEDMLEGIERLDIGLTKQQQQRLLDYMHFQENRSESEISYEEFAKALHRKREFKYMQRKQIEMSTPVCPTDDETSHEKSLPLRASELNHSMENTPTGHQPAPPCLQDAILNYKCAMDIAQSTVGSEDAQTIKIAARIGHLWYLVGDYHHALREFYHCVEKAEQLDPSYAGFLGSLYFAIANILCNGSNQQQDRAMIMYTKSITVISRMFGADSPSVAASFTGIALVWMSRGQPAPAMRHFLQAEALARQHFGEKDRISLYLLQCVAVSYLHLGDPRMAIETLDTLENIYNVATKQQKGTTLTSHVLHPSQLTPGSPGWLQATARQKAKRTAVGLTSTAKHLWNVTSLLYSWSSSQPRKSILKDVRAQALRLLAQKRGMDKHENRGHNSKWRHHGPELRHVAKIKHKMYKPHLHYYKEWAENRSSVLHRQTYKKALIGKKSRVWRPSRRMANVENDHEEPADWASSLSSIASADSTSGKIASAH